MHVVDIRRPPIHSYSQLFSKCSLVSFCRIARPAVRYASREKCECLGLSFHSVFHGGQRIGRALTYQNNDRCRSYERVSVYFASCVLSQICRLSLGIVFASCSSVLLQNSVPYRRLYRQAAGIFQWLNSLNPAFSPSRSRRYSNLVLCLKIKFGTSVLLSTRS